MLYDGEAKHVLHDFLEGLLKLQNVERGSIWVKEDGKYVCIEAMGDQSEKVKGIAIDPSQPSIVGWVIEHGWMEISKVDGDPRHFREIEDDFSEKSNVILCYPLFLDTGDVFGAIELIDTSRSGDRMNFNKEHLELIENMVKMGSMAIAKYVAYSRQLERTADLERIIRSLSDQKMVIGKSTEFLNVIRKIENYAVVDYPVLITGESGTGKEYVARELHRLSARRKQPILTQNCSTIPETLLESELFGHKKGAFTGAAGDKKGLFEAADGGTIFLDEIGDMPYSLQARLLRFLQNGEIKPLGSTKMKKVNVRIISATNMDLHSAIDQKLFRKDLFHRLHVLPLHLPPLRERKEDIPVLLENFISRESRILGLKSKKISEDAMRILMDYSWEGNIRELENFVKHIMVVAERDTITAESLPSYITNDQHLKKSDPEAADTDSDARTDNTQTLEFKGYTWTDLEKAYAQYLLEKNRWNITRSAKEAGVNRSTFDARLKKLGIHKSS